MQLMVTIFPSGGSGFSIISTCLITASATLDWRECTKKGGIHWGRVQSSNTGIGGKKVNVLRFWRTFCLVSSKSLPKSLRSVQWFARLENLRAPSSEKHLLNMQTCRIVSFWGWCFFACIKELAIHQDLYLLTYNIKQPLSPYCFGNASEITAFRGDSALLRALEFWSPTFTTNLWISLLSVFCV